MDLLRAGLAPFVEREVQAAAKAGTVRMDAVRRSVALAFQFHLFRLPACKRPAAEPAARETGCRSRPRAPPYPRSPIDPKCRLV